MEYQDIIYSVEEHIATITLNRPETLNAFTTNMLDEWVDAIEAAKRDPKVRVLVVTGAGRGFCSGMNVRGAAGGGEQPPVYARRNYMRLGVHRVPRALEGFDKPYIASINGPAAGAGLSGASPSSRIHRGCWSRAASSAVARISGVRMTASVKSKRRARCTCAAETVAGERAARGSE